MIILAAVLLAGSAMVTADDEVFLFRYANAQNPGDPRSVSMEFFKSELEQRSEGRIRVENYFGGILGTEREIADAVAIGALQGTRGGMFEDASIKFNIVLLPYLVEGWEEAICLVRSPWMMRVAAEGRSRGFHIPAVGISQGFRAHGSRTRAIRRVADFDGLKIRVPNAQEVFHRMENALGANPQGIAQSETYSALRTGVVDGTTAPPSDIWDRRQYEVLGWITIDAHATGPDPLMVNLAWYERLPADLQAIFDEVAIEAMELSDRLYSASEARIIADLAEHVEIIHPTPEVRAEMRRRTRPVYDFFVDRGDFTWDDINAAVAASKSCLINSSQDSSLDMETKPSQPAARTHSATRGSTSDHKSSHRFTTQRGTPRFAKPPTSAFDPDPVPENGRTGIGIGNDSTRRPMATGSFSTSFGNIAASEVTGSKAPRLTESAMRGAEQGQSSGDASTSSCTRSLRMTPTRFSPKAETEAR